MPYIFIGIILFALELVYFKLANKFNIIDKPNERSSHTKITLRGGGIIFYLSALLFFINSGFQYPYFFLGLTLISLISFLDDILTISNKLRVSVHLLSVLLLFYQNDIFHLFPFITIIITIVVVIGTINAYNFMDGINGITAAYSISVLSLLAFANTKFHFMNQDLIYYLLIATILFSFFNFRDQAKCFAGDIGSVSMAFIIIFIVSALVIKTNNLIFMLFLSIYGIDTIFTILRRLRKKENIFKAHRSHLYQYLSNEAGYNKLFISILYGFIQLIVGLFIFNIIKYDIKIQILSSFILLLILSATYIITINSIIKKFKIGE